MPQSTEKKLCWVHKTYFKPPKSMDTKQNLGIQTTIWDTQKNRFGIPRNRFEIPKNRLRVPKNNVGYLKNDLGVPPNQFWGTKFRYSK